MCMYEKLTDLIKQEKYQDVLDELKQYDTSDYTEELTIIAASVFLAVGDNVSAKKYIQLGLALNPQSYELYLLLGNYFEQRNMMQAYLCYENAELYCDNADDREVIKSFKRKVEEESTLPEKKVSVVILSSNKIDLIKECIAGVRKNCLGAYCEIIVVDNAFADDSVEWLERQEDITLIKNQEGRGVLYGINQGIKAASPEADILLLEDDVIMLPNSLFWLRIGLYEEDGIGATGSVSNDSENGQECFQKHAPIDEYMGYALKNNTFQENPYEMKFFLERFAMLIRREAIDGIGMMDVRFMRSHYADRDLGMRLCQAGWKIILCHNSSVYRTGAGGSEEDDGNAYLFDRNRFREKWAFDMDYYIHSRKEIIDLIKTGKYDAIRVLEVGCGLGATLAEIQYRYPHAQTYGIELVPEVAEVSGKFMNVVQGDIEKMDVPFENIEFDYIILADILEHLHDPKKIIQKLATRLKRGGAILGSIPNIMNLSVIYPLLCGNFEYEDAGILDRTHLRFFTLDSIYKLCNSCGFCIDELGYTMDDAVLQGCYKECLECILKLPGCADEKLFLALQYFFRAVRRENEQNGRNTYGN